MAHTFGILVTLKNSKSRNSCSVFLSTNKTVYSTHTHSTHRCLYFLCFGSHLNVHWIRPQTHWFTDTCCILILQNRICKHCRSITLSKCLLMTLDGLPSKSFYQLVLWCISYHHFMLLCVSINVQFLAKHPLRQTDDEISTQCEFNKCHRLFSFVFFMILGAFLWRNNLSTVHYHCEDSQLWLKSFISFRI